MVNDMPDPVQFFEGLGSLIATAAGTAKGEHSRVGIFGECVQLLCAQGNADGAIRLEQLWDQIVRSRAVDVLCGYSLASVQGGAGSHVFEKICAEHSAAHWQ
jgi:hypothetical protein